MNRRLWLGVALAGGAACATPGQVRRVETQVAILEREQFRSDSTRSAQWTQLQLQNQRLFDSVIALSRLTAQAGRDNNSDLADMRKQLYNLYALVGASSRQLSEMRAAAEARQDAQIAGTVSTTRDSSIPPAAAGLPSAESVLLNARRYYNLGTHTTAREAFRDVVKNYPTSPLVPDALYGIGDTFRGTSQPDSAIAYYTQVADRYREAMIAASALYQLGLIAEDRGQHTLARGFFQRIVVDRYATTDVYLLAQKWLREHP